MILDVLLKRGYVTPGRGAKMINRNKRLVNQWIHDGELRVYRLTHRGLPVDGHRFVKLKELHAVALRHPRRNRP